MGAALGHCLVAYESTLKGLSRLEVNEAVITADLLDRWEVLAEAVAAIDGAGPSQYQQCPPIILLDNAGVGDSSAGLTHRVVAIACRWQ